MDVYTNPRIVICCNQIDCDYNCGRFVSQDPTYTNQTMYTNVCIHHKPDIYDKKESIDNTMHDVDAQRTNCNSYENTRK
jgi:hypothetical protein